jgi:enoyl-[acyl-carrier protein] reductase I
MGLLQGKKAVIFGVANERSIAWAIAQKMKEEGAELAFTYAGPAFLNRVTPLAEQLGSSIILPCDVTKDDEIDGVFSSLEKEWGELDILVHSLAFANKEELKGDYVDTSREGFRLAMDVSAYSLVALTRGAAPLMEKTGSGSVITMTYYGSEKVIENYNVMGVAKSALESSVRYLAEDLGKKNIRVNSVSAGPLKTLAAMGISGFRLMLDHVAERAPMRRNVTTEDVAGTVAYLASDLASGVTGECLHVDCGYNIIGL